MQVVMLSLQIAGDAQSVCRPALISGQLVNPAEVNPDRIHLRGSDHLTVICGFRASAAA